MFLSLELLLECWIEYFAIKHLDVKFVFSTQLIVLAVFGVVDLQFASCMFVRYGYPTLSNSSSVSLT